MCLAGVAACAGLLIQLHAPGVHDRFCWNQGLTQAADGQDKWDVCCGGVALRWVWGELGQECGIPSLTLPDKPGLIRPDASLTSP